MSDQTPAERRAAMLAGIEATHAAFDAQTEGVVAELSKEGGIFGRLTASIVRFFSIGFTKVWIGFHATFEWILEPIRFFVSGDIFRMSTEDIKAMTGTLGALDMFDADDMIAIENTIKRIPVLATIAGPLVRIMLMGQLFKAWTDVLGSTAIQRLNKKYSPTVPAPEAIAKTSFIAPELHSQVVDAMKRSGLSQDDIELLFVSMYSLENPGEIMQLFWRGELSKDQAINRMSELGYTPTRTAELMRLWERIPGLADIVRYLGKEAFEPAMIKKFGLLEDYPRAETEKWVAKQGLAPEWAEKEWISHWRDIGITPVLAGLHRHITLNNGQDVDSAFVNDYMRLIEIPAPIRDLVEKTSYSPYTRVDARRMHDMGVLSDDELVGVYEAQGYDNEHAINMALFTIRYNSREGKSFTRSDVEKAYEDGDLDFNTCLLLLMEAGFHEDYAGFLLTRVDIEKERAKRLDATESIKARFLSYLVNATETRNMLLSIGFTTGRANELLDRWTAIQISNTKLPSKTDLDKLLKHDIIDDSEYKSQMTKLGYAGEYIEWYLRLSKSGTE